MSSSPQLAPKMRSCRFNQQVVGGPCEALEIMPDGDVRILSERRMPAPAVGPPVATPAGRQKPAPSSQCDEEECVVEEVFLN